MVVYGGEAENVITTAQSVVVDGAIGDGAIVDSAIGNGAIGDVGATSDIGANVPEKYAIVAGIVFSVVVIVMVVACLVKVLVPRYRRLKRKERKRAKKAKRLAKLEKWIAEQEAESEEAKKAKKDEGFKPKAVSTPREGPPASEGHYFKELLEAGIATTEELPLSPKPWSNFYFDIEDDTFHLDL